MSDGRPQAKWEPGTLDKTRQNIGNISKEEAARMTKVLGGEIFVEKSKPINYDSLPKKAPSYAHRSSGRSASDVAAISARNRSSSGGSSSFSSGEQEEAPVKKKTSADGLPSIPSKEASLMDKLMMSDDYKIKQNCGIFNFVRKFRKNGTELVSRGFIEYNLKMHVDHMQAFMTTVKSIMQVSPDSYKARIAEDEQDKFRLLRAVSGWSIGTIKTTSMDLQEHPDSVTVGMMTPFIKAVYRDVLKIYYLGEQTVSNIFKDIYNDLMKYPKADKEALVKLSKDGLTEWIYVYTQVIKGLYPLLMRMCSSKYDIFPHFFTSQTASIFSFLGITKFDLILPQKKEAVRQEEESAAKEEEKKEEEKKEEEEKKPSPEEEKDDIVRTGLNLLNTLFPQAGFDRLDSMPDMFPYFEPLYDFEDGYNVISPQNPMMITMVLLRISEDIFQGLRNVKFTDDMDEGSSDKETLTAVLNDWSSYREILFEKHYLDELLELVNKQYSQSDFKTSNFGKKLITSLLWRTRYDFLPHYEFEQLLLEKPIRDNQFRPLCLRTTFLRNTFAAICRSADAAAKERGTVHGIQNPWDKYEFDIPNIISKRMDVLLGAKRPAKETAATNANLIKYALCVVAVLDWWLNSKGSPAYATDSSQIYRINERDGGPAFSVPLRNDQNKLFADAVKAAVQKQKDAAAKAAAAQTQAGAKTNPAPAAKTK